MTNELFKFYTPDFKKLSNFGFELKNEAYFYGVDILQGDMQLQVFVSKSGEVKTKIFDNASQEEYILHLLNAQGEFVGRVKSECEQVLLNIRATCFFKDVFKSPQAKRLLKYVEEQYCGQLEFLWEKSPNIAVLRRKDSRKWYAVLFVMSKKRLGIDDDSVVDIIDIRSDCVASLCDGKTFFAGYHMNKKSWLTFCLDGSVKFKDIQNMIDKSYQLAK